LAIRSLFIVFPEFSAGALANRSKDDSTSRTAVNVNDNLRRFWLACQSGKPIFLRGEPAAFTNGGFDLLHVGHISLREQARRFSYKFLVTVNSDESVPALKGREHSIVGEDERPRVGAALAALSLLYQAKLQRYSDGRIHFITEREECVMRYHVCGC
jgi:cytidyltransferase-like protein